MQSQEMPFFTWYTDSRNVVHTGIARLLISQRVDRIGHRDSCTFEENAATAITTGTPHVHSITDDHRLFSVLLLTDESHFSDDASLRRLNSIDKDSR